MGDTFWGRVRAAARGRASVMLVTVLALGWARAWGGRPRFVPGHWFFIAPGMRGGFARGGTTVGGVFLTDREPSHRVIRHEAIHADQWARSGLLFPLRYWREELRHPMARNRFEIEAGLEDGGYRAPRS